MKLTCTWKQKMILEASDGKHSLVMDAKYPIGDDTALNPKQLVLSGLCGCTSMDVLSLLKKHKQTFDSYVMEAGAEMNEQGHPKVFQKIDLKIIVTGAVDAKVLEESVRLSQTRYCGVAAMLSKAVPIHYQIHLNGTQIATGEAQF